MLARKGNDKTIMEPEPAIVISKEYHRDNP